MGMGISINVPVAVQLVILLVGIKKNLPHVLLVITIAAQIKQFMPCINMIDISSQLNR